MAKIIVTLSPQHGPYLTFLLSKASHSLKYSSVKVAQNDQNEHLGPLSLHLLPLVSP
jgi:hypothetical protein